DAEGNDSLVTRYGCTTATDCVGKFPDLVGIITTSWLYDRAGHPVTEIAPDGQQERRYFGPSGNLDSVQTRRGHWIRMTYDAMNRLKTKIVPSVSYADTIPAGSIGARDMEPYPFRPTPDGGYVIAADTLFYSYSDVGQLIDASNSDSRIQRSY